MDNVSVHLCNADRFLKPCEPVRMQHGCTNTVIIASIELKQLVDLELFCQFLSKNTQRKSNTIFSGSPVWGLAAFICLISQQTLGFGLLLNKNKTFYDITFSFGMLEWNITKNVWSPNLSFLLINTFHRGHEELLTPPNSILLDLQWYKTEKMQQILRATS